MTNQERALRGARTINSYIDRFSILAVPQEPACSPGEAAIDAVTDILHAYCDGDELAAEDLLRTAKMHFVQETDACGQETDACGEDEEAEDCRCTVTRGEDGREEREIDAGCPLHGQD